MPSCLSPTKAGLALLAVLVGGWMLFSGGAFEADAVTDDQYQGTVMSAGDSALMIESTPDNNMLSFRVESSTQITKDGERVKLEKVSNGDGVTVVSKSKNNERIATSIAAHSPY